jgi:hypothetical protein
MSPRDRGRPSTSAFSTVTMNRPDRFVVFTEISDITITNAPRSSRSASREPRTLESRVNSFPSVQGDETCDDCNEPDPDTYFCNVCTVYLCKQCWPKQLAHRTQRLARGGPKHEKTNISLARKINNVLMPTNDPKELTILHEDDAQTAWFGLSSLSCSLDH